MRLHLSMLVLGIGLFAAGLQTAESADEGSGPTPDAVFMKKLAAGNLAEEDAGRLASQKAANPAVKEFGQHMVKDHSQNGDDLGKLAKTQGVELPSTIDSKHGADKAKLDAATGASFDRLYIQGQVADHEKAVQLLQHEIEHGREATVKDFAQKTLPVVRHHLEMAKDLQLKLPVVAQQDGR